MRDEKRCDYMIRITLISTDKSGANNPVTVIVNSLSIIGFLFSQVPVNARPDTPHPALLEPEYLPFQLRP